MGTTRATIIAKYLFKSTDPQIVTDRNALMVQVKLLHADEINKEEVATYKTEVRDDLKQSMKDSMELWVAGLGNIALTWCWGLGIGIVLVAGALFFSQGGNSQTYGAGKQAGIDCAVIALDGGTCK